MAKTDTDRAIALSALLLSTRLVDDVARRGLADAQDCATCFRSILQLDAPNALTIYGGLSALKRGLLIAQQQLHQPRHGPDTAYALTLLMIDRQFRKRPDLQNYIAQKVSELNEHSLEMNELAEPLAAIYTHTISTINTRVIVRGTPTHLTIPENAQRIRALLLAGLRAAVLWRQSGGSLWRLIWHRRALLDATRNLLERPLSE